MSDAFSSLVSTQWLAENLSRCDVVVLDASKHLPTAKRDPRVEFEDEHIAGARFLDLNSLTDTASHVPAALPSPDQVAQHLAQLGVNANDRIVLYDDSAVKTSARAWLALTVNGVPNVAVLDGGLSQWRAQGRPLESGWPSINPPLNPISAASLSRKDRIASKADMLANLHNKARPVLDARGADRVFGTGIDPVHGGRNGRIPGSLNLPFGAVFNDDGTFKSTTQLQALFPPETVCAPTITSCGSGVTASVLLFALHLIGNDDVSLYDGSWQEWEADPETPKAQGPDLPEASANTRLAHAGRRQEWTGRVVNTPVWRASTHLYENEAQRKAATAKDYDGHFFYGRKGAPTQWSLAEALTQIEPGAAGTVLYPSGVAAIAGALLAVMRPGDTVLMSDNAYDPSRSMASGLLKQLGMSHAFFDPLDIPAFEALVKQHSPRAIWLESPGSLTMEVCDVPALTRIARDADAISLIDNTWASPLGFAGLEHGCDIVMMSLSKHVGGHSDVMMGSCSAGQRWYKALRRTSQQLGQVVSPDDAALAARGLRTMGVRLKHSTDSAIEIAHWLSRQPQIAQVMCPMLPGDASYDMWSRDFTGGCGLFSFVLNSDDPDASGRMVDALHHFGIGYSWGGFESLALPIFPHVHRDAMITPTQAETGLKPAIRLSIGLEDPQDLIADLAQALSQLDD